MNSRIVAALLMFFTACICCGENFEKLVSMNDARKASLTKAGWTLKGNNALPYGWYIGKYGAKNPEYRVVESTDPKLGKHIFIRGGFTVDATMIKQQQNHEYVIMEFSAKAEKMSDEESRTVIQSKRTEFFQSLPQFVI